MDDHEKRDTFSRTAWAILTAAILLWGAALTALIILY